MVSFWTMWIYFSCVITWLAMIYDYTKQCGTIAMYWKYIIMENITILETYKSIDSHKVSVSLSYATCVHYYYINMSLNILVITYSDIPWQPQQDHSSNTVSIIVRCHALNILQTIAVAKFHCLTAEYYHIKFINIAIVKNMWWQSTVYLLSKGNITGSKHIFRIKPHCLVKVGSSQGTD